MMSSNKRRFDWLGVPSSGNSTKRPKSPAPQAASSNVSGRNTSNYASQSSAPPSTSPSTSVPRGGASVKQQASSTRHAILSTLKGSMKLLRKGCHTFSPLKETVETLLEVLEVFETTRQDSEELRETVSDLAEWATVLSDYLSDPWSESTPGFVENLREELAKQAEHIRTQQQGGQLSRLLESGKEIKELEKCYHRIETSLHQLQTDTALRTWKIAGDQLKESRLSALNPSYDAFYNSSFSDKIERRGCLENTRASVLDGIRGWIRDPSGAKIHWTNGMAGTGKTTIAYSICAELERDGRLGASFFCSRVSSECSDVSRILPTIAYQLAEQFSPFRSSLCRILGQKPSIGHCSISVQFEHLIQTPLVEVADMVPNGHVIVIDALDECSDPRTVEMMLDALFRHVPKLPIRFFLASRPEPAIANTFLSRDDHSHSILHLHNVEEQLVKDDIETYLTAKLAKLSLSEDQINQLAEQAGVLFIYAATLTRYILATTTGANAAARLITVLTGSKNKKNKKDREIDLLYNAILDGVLGQEELEEDEVELIKHVIWTVVCVREPVSIGTLAALLNVHHQQASMALQPLRSVINVIEGSEVVSTLHASFPEFILSSERSGTTLSCNWRTHHEYLTTRCFKLMEDQLRFNICGLETSCQFDNDVPNLESRVKDCISLGLFYACQYWAKHLRQSSTCDELLTCLDTFLHKQLLFWMEVLNLKGLISNGEEALADAQEWLASMGRKANTHNFVRDAQTFVATFARNPVYQSTPHIYTSALPLVPKQSEVWKCYWGRTRGLLCADAQMREQDGAAVEIQDVHRSTSHRSPFEGHAEGVTSVALSRDGTRIVYGSENCMIRGWDLRHGTPLGGSFKGHMAAVSSVTFSPDGTRIASGSWDFTLRVWDAHNGTQLGSPFEGHSNIVTSVAFSPDGARLVSGSWDRTIRLWDVHSNTTLVSFKGHADRVSSVGFSPDGAHIVSGSHDRRVRVWNVHSGTPYGTPFEGHTGWVTSVAFSPDGTHIVSGSYDRTIRVWEMCSGTTLGIPFQGHTSWISSVAFSHEGTHIVSGSYDCTIRVWDVHSGVPVGGPLCGHTSWVSSVAFSPDSSHIVSGSSDSTTRVWENHSIPRPHGTRFGRLRPKGSGWLVDPTSQTPMFWLPEELSSVFPWPPNILTISPLRSIKSRCTPLLLGESWVQCYVPSNDGHI